jgi:hypothetical protein
MNHSEVQEVYKQCKREQEDMKAFHNSKNSPLLLTLNSLSSSFFIVATSMDANDVILQ